MVITIVTERGDLDRGSHTGKGQKNRNLQANLCTFDVGN